jgi:hypothetical protein
VRDGVGRVDVEDLAGLERKETEGEARDIYEYDGVRP